VLDSALRPGTIQGGAVGRNPTLKGKRHGGGERQWYKCSGQTRLMRLSPMSCSFQPHGALLQTAVKQIQDLRCQPCPIKGTFIPGSSAVTAGAVHSFPLEFRCLSLPKSRKISLPPESPSPTRSRLKTREQVRLVTLSLQLVFRPRGPQSHSPSRLDRSRPIPSAAIIGQGSVGLSRCSSLERPPHS
jgi:hypothetical protein